MGATVNEIKVSTTSSKGSAVGIASQAYASRVQLLMQLITELRSVGAHVDFDLPRIVVIGNQSAGKSSLVEAISGITVPRSSGCCTRCPMECRLSYSANAWKAKLFIRIEQDEDGNPVTDIREVPFGGVVTDKAQLERRIKQAQSAILNPTVDPEHFLISDNPPLTARKPLQFSSSVVCIDISGPEVTDLSFIDLPGLISNVADGEDRNNIELVKALVNKHISGNALILLTLTMRDDLENQSAAFLAKEADRPGLRTIGVLTKPDTLQEGEHKSWLEVLERKKHQLRHGYFVTKQPAPSDLEAGLDHHVARNRERDFFNNEEPWKSAPSSVRGRMGVPNLTKELSRLLSQLIERLLPKLREDSRVVSADVAKLLQDLPPAVSENPTAELLHLTTTLSTEVNAHIRGVEKHEGLIRGCRSHYIQFGNDILGTQPNFVPTSKSTLKSARYEEASETPIEERPTNEPIYLDEVKVYLESALTRQLPYNVPFQAKVGLINRQFREWQPLAEKCFRMVCGATRTVLMGVVQEHTKRFTRGGLSDRVASIVDKILQSAQQETEARLAWIIGLESPPFTINFHYFSSYREKYLAEFKAKRVGAESTPKSSKPPPNRRRSHGFDDESDFESRDPNDALAELAKLGFRNLSPEHLERLRGPDPFEHELICMAEVRAYFQVAYKRIIDNVPRVIDHDYLKAIGRRVQKELFMELGLSDNDANQRAHSYLAEDPELVADREELLQKKARLQLVCDKLERFTA